MLRPRRVAIRPPSVSSAQIEAELAQLMGRLPPDERQAFSNARSAWLLELTPGKWILRPKMVVT